MAAVEQVVTEGSGHQPLVGRHEAADNEGPAAEHGGPTAAARAAPCRVRERKSGTGSQRDGKAISTK